MSESRIGVRVLRNSGLLGVALVLALALAPATNAAGVSADCGDGDIFFTFGTADNWQDHTHDSLLTHFYYYGRRTMSRNWGYEFGLETGTVAGPNLGNPHASCIL